LSDPDLRLPPKPANGQVGPQSPSGKVQDGVRRLRSWLPSAEYSFVKAVSTTADSARPNRPAYSPRLRSSGQAVLPRR
jgi:hypothetical protein